MAPIDLQVFKALRHKFSGEIIYVMLLLEGGLKWRKGPGVNE